MYSRSRARCRARARAKAKGIRRGPGIEGSKC